jgi:zinc D-Ala-D-Ala carboxypeptidase
MLSPTTTDLQLSPHFWLSEFEHSQTATRLGLRNEASAVELQQLKRLALRMEDVRALLGGVPIIGSSGLRTLIVNGLATRVISHSTIPFKQLIFEGTWVHLAIEEEGQKAKREVLTAVFKQGEKTRYLPGLV